MKERNSGKAAKFAAFLITILIVPIAFATIDVSPVRLDLSDDHDKAVIRIGNQDSAAKSYEVEVVAWSQTDERREVYSPTEDLLAVPPLFTLQPGDEQLVRVGMLKPADAGVERSYRVFITELKPPETQEPTEPTISMRVQIGIPVFVAPTSLPSATLDYIDSTEVDEQLFLRMKNNGNTHIKISETQFTPMGSDSGSSAAVSIYLLAGESGYVPVSISDEQTVGTVTFITDTLGNVEYELPITP